MKNGIKNADYQTKTIINNNFGNINNIIKVFTNAYNDLIETNCKERLFTVLHQENQNVT